MAIELNVFTYDFERIGTIENYINLSIERNYYARSVMELTVEGSNEMIELLQKHRVITTTTNINYGYLITNFNYIDDETEQLTIYAFSLNHLFDWRTIGKQERYSGAIETVLKKFIDNNCITTSTNRIIPRLKLLGNSGIAGTTNATVTGTNLEEFVWTYCETHEMTVDVIMNHETKQYEVYTWQGEDKSELASTNAVKFSKEFENVTNIEFVRDESDYRTTALVAGEGEGNDRQIVIVNDGFSGLNRKEIFVDARDIQSTYVDENNVEVTVTPTEYAQMLIDRGQQELADKTIIETFEGEVIDTQFKYGVDYSLGDIVSFRSERLKRVLHTRVTSSTITVDDNKKVTLKISFGNKIPTLLDKIRKVVK